MVPCFGHIGCSEAHSSFINIFVRQAFEGHMELPGAGLHRTESWSRGVRTSFAERDNESIVYAHGLPDTFNLSLTLPSCCACLCCAGGH